MAISLHDDANADDQGLPPLGRAARLGDAEAVRALLNAGVLPDAPDEEGGTPLSWAADARIARLLVEAGADVEARDADGRTPLAAAAEAGRPDVVDYLLSLGADPLGSTPDEWREGARERQAAEGRRAERRADTRTQALVTAAALGQVEEVARLLEEGADPDGLDDGEESALLKAAFSGHTEVVRLLLEAGAAPDGAAAPDEWTPLAHALNRNRRDIARLLLSAGADVHQAIDGRSLLDLAAGGGGTDEVRLLLDAGADPQGKSRAEWARATREEKIRRGRTCQEVIASLEAQAQKAAPASSADATEWPAVIHLIPHGATSSLGAVGFLRAALRGEGFVRAGAFGLDEVPGYFIEGLVSPEEALTAVIHVRPGAGVWLDVIARLADGSVVIHTSAALGVGLIPPPGCTRTHHPGADMGVLLAAARADPDRPRRPVTAAGFAAGLERDYAAGRAL